MTDVVDASQLQPPPSNNQGAVAAVNGLSATGLFQLQPPADGTAELLRHRFLCRRGSLLIVGNTGIGKSSLITQLMMQWALGVQSLGIEPVGSLKSLLIQGENDEMDLIEMRDGVAGMMGLSDDQRATISDNVMVFHDYSHTGQTFIDGVVRPLMDQHRPDLLWIDPVLQYLGGDGNDQEVVGCFLREQLNPLIQQFNAATILIHHTVKPKGSQRDSNINLSAYDAAGSAEFSNWPRAVLSLRVTRQPGIYSLVAGKRGNRLRWVKPDGCTRSYERTIRHSVEPGVICWVDDDQQCNQQTVNAVAAVDGGGRNAAVNVDAAVNANPAAVVVNTQAEQDAETVLTLIPQTGVKLKNQIIEEAKPSLSEKRVRAALQWLIDNGRIIETQQHRPKKKPAVCVERVVVDNQENPTGNTTD